MRETEFKSFDGTILFARIWDNCPSPKGVVQLIHGMKEHAGRYDELATFLNNYGFIVYADDHRAHGKTASSIETVGKYALKSNIYQDSVKDEIEISKMLHEKYKGLPLFVFGHSYGSLIAQKYIQDYSDYSGAIICGTSYMNTLENNLAKIIARLTMAFKGDNAPAKLIEKLSFSSYSKGLPEGEMWITHNKKVCKAYREDPFCNTAFSAKFYYDMMKGTTPLYSKKRLATISKQKPILLIAGAEDKFSKNAKLVRKLYKAYKKAGIINTKLKIYPGMRHEIHNEINNAEVLTDIKNFFLENTK
ncbi:MAG: lysophospholipase [Clostridia bacterium]|nr:lysophospholipase [Clostridia bacterium]